MAYKVRSDSYEVRVKPKLELVVAWRRRGLSNEQIAENLGISIAAFYNYQKRHEEFGLAIEQGAEETELHVENKLVKRALGYNYKEVTRERRVVINESGKEEYKLVVTKSVVKHVVPDIEAIKYYLEHRSANRWQRTPQAELEIEKINKAMQSVADLINNPVKTRKIGDENEDSLD